MSTTLKSSVNMIQEVVAVVDNGIVVANSIVLVFLREVERSKTLEVRIGSLGSGKKVTAHLTEQYHSVGNNLHLANDTHDTVNRVGWLIQLIILLIHYKFRVGFQHIATRCENAHCADGAN